MQWPKGLGDYIVYRHFQNYFSYIMAVSLYNGGNRSTWRKPTICRKSLTNFILNKIIRIKDTMMTNKNIDIEFSSQRMLMDYLYRVRSN